MPTDPPPPPAKIAAQCNNAAWDLIEKPDLSPGETTQLVTLAATARHFWLQVGNANQIAFAELLFGWALARAGSAAAQHSAGLAFEALKDGSDWDRAFAHAAMAAASAGHDAQAHGTHYAEAARFGAALSGGDAKYFTLAFANVPKP